jgi:hypothetical protein
MVLTSTRYQKSIKSVPDNHVFMLKSGGNNKKLGRRIKKTAWAGAPIFSLTLTERDTCPTSCHHWEDCYGNNMPFAARYSVADYAAFISRLEHEVDTLIAKHGKIAIRLHVLGDFFSEEYVTFWDEMLCKHPGLFIWGYTARTGCKIDMRIVMLNSAYPERCVIRWSRNNDSLLPNIRYAADESFEGQSFTCPEQTGKTDSCATCGACWQSSITVKFLSH